MFRIRGEDKNLFPSLKRFCVDFGQDIRVLPTGYSFKYGSSGKSCCPRNWKFQACEEYPDTVEGEDSSVHPQWVTLSNHENDTTIDSSFGIGRWKLPPQSSRRFRYFRIIQTGPNSHTSDLWRHSLVASGFEVFGQIIETSKGSVLVANDDIKPPERSWSWVYRSHKVSFGQGEHRNGPGTFQGFTGGRSFTYVGDWRDNKKQGYGTLTFDGGGVYKGWWDNDARDGYGDWYEIEDGAKICYTGNWKSGKRHGFGTYIGKCTETNTLGSGLTTRRKDLEHFIGLKEIVTKENGKKTCSMGKVLSVGWMGVALRGLLSMTICKGKGV